MGRRVVELARLGWLADLGEAVNDIFAHWRDLGLPAAEPLSAEAPRKPASGGPGRNDPCPCGSGKKYKKCCGANGAEAEGGEAES